MTLPTSKIRVVVVDDSALVRKILSDGLRQDGDIEVVGVASDPYQARDMIVQMKPDVITLDVEMPRMDGVTFLKRLMPILPTPVVMISSLTEKGKRIYIEALEAGAVDVITKPAAGVVDALPAMLDDIRLRVKAAARVDVRRMAFRPAPVLEKAKALEETTDRIIALGVSTSGVQALSQIMPAFPANAPAIAIVQHMPGGVTGSFAQRLAGLCTVRVKEAEDGDRLVPGLALVAPGGARHMTVVRSGGQYRVALKDGPLVCYSRPAVDVLFQSLAEAAGRNVAAAVLTGMGRDGAAGLKAIRSNGGHTFAQDEQTCVVFGMPKAAIEAGGAEVTAPLQQLPGLLVRAVTSKQGERG